MDRTRLRKGTTADTQTLAVMQLRQDGHTKFDLTNTKPTDNMKNPTKFLLIISALLVTLSSCSHYKSLYFSTKTEYDSVKTFSQKLKTENENLTGQNSNLLTENGQLKQENIELKEQIDISKKTKSFDLFTRLLCCDKTTEQGADEVYITILGTKKGSNDFYTRIPSTTTHWDMNDGNQGTDNPTGDSHCISNRTLFHGELKPGETYFLNVSICEEDGGTTKKYQEIAAEIIKQSGDPYVATAGELISIITKLGGFFTDTDDWMGMFGVKVTNNDGVISVEWSSKEGIIHMIPDHDFPSDINRKELRMNHDGSNYVGWFGIR